ncbi:MAG: F0F1 ATP synthase subunit delta [Solobacterium sp.]|nr:F0F1 ATP synthase subunit delta [Solobacterium sp.]
MANEIAGRYAEALFELSAELNQIEERKEEAQIILSQFHENPDLFGFFRAVQISRNEKKEVIEKILADFTPETRNFMKLLVDKDRMYYVIPILEAFIAKADEALGIETAVVTSARELSAEQLTRIRGALEKKTGHKIRLITKLDKSLIAGIKVSAGSVVTDVSVARQMEEMKETLLRGGIG